MPPTDDTVEFLKWEYTTAGRSPEIWSSVTTPLLRAADHLWDRAQDSLSTWRNAFEYDSKGRPTSTGRKLSEKEIELLRDRELDRPALLLLGCAIEALAKTVLIQRHPELVSDSGTIAAALKHHNLERLVREGGVAMSSELSRNLVALQDYLWLGRYPIPTHFEGAQSAEGGWNPNVMTPRREIWAACRELADRLVRLRDE
jgi:hypothetical protein